ncbi:FTR1 family iron permease [Gottfriedia luciferensis]|uniref:FTR1 family iron permease n=1 Tax=Gottfriedia luciferensis TaxID=178774 RepID=UPI000B431FD6|nr:FTR1 family protein [Gottfriedia luciferensis]
MKQTLIKLILPMLLFLSIPIKTFAASPEEDLTHANSFIENAIQAAQKGDYKSAEQQYKQFNDEWLAKEDGIKNKSIEAYGKIEEAMGMVQYNLIQKTMNQDALVTSLKELEGVNEKFISHQFASSKLNSKNTGSVEDLIQILNNALSDLKNNNVSGATSQIEQFRKSWINIEGVVLTQSQTVYTDAERDMVTSYAMLTAKTPDVKAATKTITNMRDYLLPLASKTSYTMLDAVTILLREGLEALLVVVGLLGFIKKSGQEEKSKWIWFGVGAGLGVSIILGVIVNMLFSAGAFGSNNFLIAGWTGVFAAVMLLYMSYWLHSKSNTKQWQNYIKTKSDKALNTGSLLSLSILAFLAVFREGTETVLFFIGMASSIKLPTLLIGIGLGLAILAILSFLILKVGLKIPMRPFFLISSILMFYLCFKFAGMGIHGLQLSGLLPATQAPIPTNDFFAIYSTWESFIPQMILLLLACITVLYNRFSHNKSSKNSEEKKNVI